MCGTCCGTKQTHPCLPEPENREHICLTLSFDHDIVDGAPAARFIRHLKRQIESAEM
ncbi:MAG: 2-oxo acid dehydrogenase subunit E2 [Mariniphaga sp.]|nr:2-oxo acid dehydrogenase subunit E2 [Mariniphaga sp.]